jgi:hypothetical protein
MAAPKRTALDILVNGGSEAPQLQQQASETNVVNIPSAAPVTERRPYVPPPCRVGKRSKTVYMSPEALRILKKIAADEDRTVEALVLEAINDWLQKRDQPRIA